MRSVRPIQVVVTQGVEIRSYPFYGRAANLHPRSFSPRQNVDLTITPRSSLSPSQVTSTPVAAPPLSTSDTGQNFPLDQTAPVTSPVVRSTANIISGVPQAFSTFPTSSSTTTPPQRSSFVSGSFSSASSPVAEPTSQPGTISIGDNKLIPIIVGIVVGITVLLVALAIVFIYRRRRRQVPEPIIEPFETNPLPGPREDSGRSLDLASSRRGSIRTVKELLPMKISPFMIFSNLSTNRKASQAQAQSSTNLLDREDTTETNSDDMQTRDDLAASRVIEHLRDGVLHSSAGGSNGLSDTDVARIALRVATLIGREDVAGHSVSEPPPDYRMASKGRRD